MTQSKFIGMYDRHNAVAIMINGRFYVSCKKRLLTAAYLCGAKLFYPWNRTAINKVKLMLDKKGYKPISVDVSIHFPF